jgi:hypothetical protein
MTDLITLPRAVVQQALEAWEHINLYGFVLADYEGPMEQAITALRAALEQPEPVAVAWMYRDIGVVRFAEKLPSPGMHRTESVALFTHPPRRETEQEPVANNPDPYHLSRILHELAGSASMCWDHVDRAGVFQSTQAADVVAAAIAEIRQRMKDAPPRRETEPAFDALVAISLLTHLGGEVADYEDVVEAVRRLHALNGELLEALLEERRVRLMGQEDDVHWESLRDMRRAAMAATDAAIARAEGKV